MLCSIWNTLVLGNNKFSDSYKNNYWNKNSYTNFQNYLILLNWQKNKFNNNLV